MRMFFQQGSAVPSATSNELDQFYFPPVAKFAIGEGIRGEYLAVDFDNDAAGADSPFPQQVCRGGAVGKLSRHSIQHDLHGFHPIR